MPALKAILFADTTLLDGSTGTSVPCTMYDLAGNPFVSQPTDQILLTGWIANVAPATFGLLTSPAGVAFYDSLVGSSSNYLLVCPAAANNPIQYAANPPAPGLPLSPGAGLSFCGFGSASLILFNFMAYATIMRSSTAGS